MSNRIQDFSHFTAEEVIDRMYEGQTLAVICGLPGMPTRRSLRKWIAQYPEFQKAYEEALLVTADLRAEEELQLARDTVSDKDITQAQVAARKMLSDSLRWHARVCNPNVYSEKAQVEHKHKLMPVEQLTDEQLAEIAAGGVRAIEPSRKALPFEIVGEARRV